ncbi:MAG: serine/threonine protein kinase, partial [Planctomycetes bacterium]|nr:serine/threonine protein kinase [Planctomycetota bacterium]
AASPAPALQTGFDVFGSMNRKARKKPTSEARKHPTLGEVFGSYRLLGELGRGGMAVIYRAEKVGSGGSVVVALKTLEPGPEEGAARRRQRFRVEIEALGRLHHDNIVKIHDSGRKGCVDYYAMDLIEGQELAEAIENDLLTTRRKLEVFLQICAGIAHAHQQHVVHRDLKPANVLLDSEGNACIIDFGLAKLSDEDLGLTKARSVLGTPHYMAPEQVGNPKEADSRADVFALGVLLYELLTGERPFKGETPAELTMRIIAQTPPRPSAINLDLPPALDRICLKALEKNVDNRYQSAGALRAEVASCLSDVLERELRRHPERSSYVVRHQSALLIGLALGFALGFLVAWLWR